MSAVRLLLAKDLRTLGRSPAAIAALIAYPLLVAAVVALALQAGDRQPRIALVDLDGSDAVVTVGDRRLTVQDYIARIEDEVDVERLDPDAAERALRDGRVAAVLTIPDGFIGTLRTGIGQARIDLQTDRRRPVEAREIRRRLESAVFRLNRELAQEYVGQVLGLVELIIDGGDIGVFGRRGTVLGLTRSGALLDEIQGDLRAGGDAATADRLDPLARFIDAAAANLDLARPAADAIREPIVLEETGRGSGRDPLSGFGVAAALVVALGLAGALLGAGALAGERDENTMVRLRRGLVRPAALAGEKVLFAGLLCAVLGAILVAAVVALTSVAGGRAHLWLIALVAAGLAFGAVGALVGALTPDARTALLAALGAALPLAVAALIPGAGAVEVAGQALPFVPARDAFQALLVDQELDGSLAVDLAQLAIIASAAWAIAAGLLGARRG